MQNFQYATPIPVALKHCPTYEREPLAESINELFAASGLQADFHGKTVLLKPNLISAKGAGLAASDPRFVAAVALWCKERGARVKLGDSPAFGTAKMVCNRHGITEALKGLDVEIVEFHSKAPVQLSCGVKVNIAREVFECDLLLNLPRIKAHNQMYMTIALKNLFGIVKGSNKAWLHMKEGGGENGHKRFSSIIFELHTLLGEQFHVADGIIAMHGAGPMDGRPLELGVLAASASPVALDTALLELLGLSREASPLWLEGVRRGVKGSQLSEISWQLQQPSEFSLPRFVPPHELSPIRFNPFRFMKSSLRRLLRRR